MCTKYEGMLLPGDEKPYFTISVLEVVHGAKFVAVKITSKNIKCRLYSRENENSKMQFFLVRMSHQYLITSRAKRHGPRRTTTTFGFSPHIGFNGSQSDFFPY